MRRGVRQWIFLIFGRFKSINSLTKNLLSYIVVVGKFDDDASLLCIYIALIDRALAAA
jgi:hypothetical protein